MRGYIIRRSLLIIPTLLLASLIVFFVLRLMPGEEVVPAAEGPQYGGTIRWFHSHGALEPQTWDPADVNWTGDVFMSAYAEPLLRGDFETYGPRGTNEFAFTDMAFIPTEYMRGLVAESWEMPDDLTVIYHIRKGIYWPDKPGVMTSRELTAKDVAFALDRLINTPKAPGYYDEFESVTATDRYTVVVKMNYYQHNWTIPLGWGYFNKLYPPEVVDAGIADWRNASGSGPFILVDYVKGTSMTFVRNPIYWDKAIIDGKEYKIPFVDELIWPIIADESTLLTAIRTAKLDVAEGINWKYTESLEETNPELVRSTALGSEASMVAMRLDDPESPWADKRVRRALSMAIDRQAILDSLMGDNGVLLSYPFSSNWPETYWTPLEALPESTRELFEYNPEKAKQLLTEAGYPDGFKAELVVLSTGAYAADAASMVSAYWAELGIELELNMAEYAAYYSIMRDKTHKHMYQMAKDNTTPFSVLMATALPGQYWNPSMIDDDYFSETFDQARHTTDIEEAQRLLKELAVYYLDEAWYVIYPTGYSYSYAYPWVKNWYGELNTGTRSPGQIPARVWIDQGMRQSMTGGR